MIIRDYNILEKFTIIIDYLSSKHLNLVIIINYNVKKSTYQSFMCDYLRLNLDAGRQNVFEKVSNYKLLKLIIRSFLFDL